MSNPSHTPIQAKPRINAVAQYLMALAAVIGCYSLYAKYAVPMLEGPPNLIPKRTFVAYEDLPPASEERTHLIPFLPRESWELDDCQTLLTESGTILFQKFEEQPDGTLTVMPFTLFSGITNKLSESNGTTNSEAPKKPTVLRCMQGANLKFDKSLSEAYAGNASLESARLIGNVDIYRPPSNSTSNDAMQILTSNVQIDRNRIYTIENVQFAFGRNKGSGRNLVLDLSHENGPKNDFSNIDGVKRMELAFLHHLRIEPTETSNAFSSAKNQDDNKTNETGSANQLFSNRKSPIEVSCKGAFVFDFLAKTASFKKEVKARLVDAFQDSIECDELILNFEEKPKPSNGLVNIESDSKDKELVGDLELKQLVAKGLPAVLTSRSRSTKVMGQILRYEVASDRVVGQCDPANELMMTIVSPEFQMVSKQLEYSIPKDNSLGQLHANGPGRLLRLAKDNQKELFISWQNELHTTESADQPGVKKITLDGQTQVRIGKEIEAKAEILNLQMEEIPRVTSPGQSKAWDYKPLRVVAEGNVEIESPKISGNTTKLNATWPRAIEAANRANTNHRVGYRGTYQISSPQDSSVVQSEGTAFGNQRINQAQLLPTQIRSGSNSGQLKAIEPQRNPFVELAAFNDENRTAKKDPVKIKFRGDEVDLILDGEGKNTEVRDLTVIGNVQVTQLDPLKNRNGNNDKPLTLTGDRLRLIPQSKDSYRAVVSTTANGRKQARVVSKDLELNGEQINLDQQANKVWVLGMGSMKLNAASIKDAQPAVPNANQLPAQGSSSQDLTVNWEGGMIFDGAKIYFERKVIMQSVDRDKNGSAVIESASEGLRIELEKPVDFRNLSKEKKIGAAKVKELLFANSIPDSKRVFKLAKSSNANTKPEKRFVVVQNKKFDPSGRLLEKQNIVVPTATANAKTGKLYAQGPGTISTHRDGEVAMGNPFSRLSKIKKRGLSFIQINFDGEMEMDSKQKSLTVKRNVRTVYAPVGSWDQTVDPDNARRSAPPGSVNLTCQQLQLAQWLPRGAAQPDSEMIATGNTHIFSQTFESNADRVSFKRSTDTLVIEGTPRNEARLRFKQSANDKNPTQMTAEKITYRIKDQRARAEAVNNISAK